MFGYSVNELIGIAVVVLIMGLGKGGFPIGDIGVPLLILIWPGAFDPTKTAISFILPLLCVADVLGIYFYRKHIEWRRLVPLIPGTLAGVLAATFLVLHKRSPVAIPDNALKFCVGLLGLLFVLYQATKKWILGRMERHPQPTRVKTLLCGFGAGFTSTATHTAGPVMQVYLLPQHLEKMVYASTFTAFFFVLNAAKLIPFALCGRIDAVGLKMGCVMLPLVPIGVAAGFGLVKITKAEHYLWLIYSSVLVVSVSLILKAVG